MELIKRTVFIYHRLSIQLEIYFWDIVDVAAVFFRESLGSVVRQNRVSSNDCILLNQKFVLNNYSRNKIFVKFTLHKQKGW